MKNRIERALAAVRTQRQMDEHFVDEEERIAFFHGHVATYQRGASRVAEEIFLEELYEQEQCMKVRAAALEAAARKMSVKLEVQAEDISLDALQGRDLSVWLSHRELKLRMTADFDTAGTITCDFKAIDKRRKHDYSKRKMRYGWLVVPERTDTNRAQIAALHRKLVEEGRLHRVLES